MSGKLKGIIAVIGFVASYALWILPTALRTYSKWGWQEVAPGTLFLLHVGAVLCLVLALFCAANLLLHALQRPMAPSGEIENG